MAQETFTLTREKIEEIFLVWRRDFNSRPDEFNTENLSDEDYAANSAEYFISKAQTLTA